MISAQDVAQLRLQTGAGVMVCKKALEDSNGDFQKAKEILAANAEAIAKIKEARAVDRLAAGGVVRVVFPYEVEQVLGRRRLGPGGGRLGSLCRAPFHHFKLCLNDFIKLSQRIYNLLAFIWNIRKCTFQE